MKTTHLEDCIRALDSVISFGEASMSDYDLFCEMNELLSEDRQVCYRTFQRYKADANAYGEAPLKEREDFDPIYKKLWQLLRRNGVRYKKDTYNAMMDCEGTKWIKYRWVLERKFSDFNLRYQTQVLLAEHDFINELAKAKTLPVAPEEPVKKAKATTPKEKEPTPEIPKMRMIDSSGKDWSEYAQEQLRKWEEENLHKQDSPEPLPAETLPFALAAIKNAPPKEQNNDQFNEPEYWEEQQRTPPVSNATNSAQSDTALSDDPWLKPDGTRLTNAEFIEKGKQRRPILFPDRAPEPPKPAFRPAPNGVKRIIGFS